MTRTIFLLGSDQRLVRLEETQYESEELLQRLIRDHPDLLAGDEFGARSPRRWLLVQREMRIADGEDSAQRWSVDHLFIDQDAIPTLVEVKRSSDTRIRREVVGQLLEYAANLVGVDLALGVPSGYWAEVLQVHRWGRCGSFLDWLSRVEPSSDFFEAVRSADEWRVEQLGYAYLQRELCRQSAQ